MTKGWKQESSRHALARKGMKTGRKKKKPYFISEPFGLPFDLQPVGKFRTLEFHPFGEYWSKAQVKKGKILARKQGWSKFKVKKGTYIGSYTLFAKREK